MHEASLMRGLMRRIETIAATEGAARVAGISVWLGALSHMTEDHFTAHFTRAAAGTIAEGAKLKLSVSDDIGHAAAQDVVLEDVEIETRE